jgi:trimethylamine:corrinoid methyltransferase-like protein
MEHLRVRARLLAEGVTVRDVSEESGVSLTMTSYVLSMRRSCATPAGQKVVAAAESLSGLTWADLIAPPRQRRAA